MVKKIITNYKRRRYVKAMMRAINRARQNRLFGNKLSRSDGLRVIRDFERINGIPFDPFDDLHLFHINGMGVILKYLIVVRRSLAKAIEGE